MCIAFHHWRIVTMQSKVVFDIFDMLKKYTDAVAAVIERTRRSIFFWVNDRFFPRWLEGRMLKFLFISCQITGCWSKRTGRGVPHPSWRLRRWWWQRSVLCRDWKRNWQPFESLPSPKQRILDHHFITGSCRRRPASLFYSLLFLCHIYNGKKQPHHAQCQLN